MKEDSFENVTDLQIAKEENGYKIVVNNESIIKVPIATNFEWRMDGPVEISHIYFGSETGLFKDICFKASFSIPCKVRISIPDARCYIYIKMVKNRK